MFYAVIVVFGSTPSRSPVSTTYIRGTYRVLRGYRCIRINAIAIVGIEHLHTGNISCSTRSSLYSDQYHRDRRYRTPTYGEHIVFYAVIVVFGSTPSRSSVSNTYIRGTYRVLRGHRCIRINTIAIVGIGHLHTGNISCSTRSSLYSDQRHRDRRYRTPSYGEHIVFYAVIVVFGSIPSRSSVSTTYIRGTYRVLRGHRCIRINTIAIVGIEHLHTAVDVTHRNNNASAVSFRIYVALSIVHQKSRVTLCAQIRNIIEQLCSVHILYKTTAYNTFPCSISILCTVHVYMVHRNTVLRRSAIRAIDAHQLTIGAFLLIRAAQSVVRGAVYRTIKNTRHIHTINCAYSTRLIGGAHIRIHCYDTRPHVHGHHRSYR